MATGVTLDYEYQDALSRVNQASDLMGSPEPMLRDMGEFLLLAHTLRFQKEIAPDGRKWKALSPAYKKVKRKNADRILFLDGYLANTMRYQVDSQGLLFGSNRPPAKWHHFGTDPYTIKPKDKAALNWPGGPGPRSVVNHPGLPARPIIGTSEEDDRRLETIAVEHTLAALRPR